MSLPKAPLGYAYSEAFKWRMQHVKSPGRSRHTEEQYKGPETQTHLAFSRKHQPKANVVNMQ